VEALNGLCQGLVAAGVPLAVGWTASILDDVAIRFAETFYEDLAAGTPIDRAVVQARRDARRLGQERSPDGKEDPSWTLPVLYAATAQAALFDPSAEPVPPPREPVKVEPLPGMTEGFAAHFVGRRRAIQRVLPRLLAPSDLKTVFITGVGGAGKSTLLTFDPKSSFV
jgi:hypothetical protein